ncbi:aminopeptidase P N-terminal domain-containing protein [Candidatus Dependentiae bacterium]|nr:aminopeptidase P N-terminal domain-containing protein [Candidatus Dependentiae bacterium]
MHKDFSIVKKRRQELLHALKKEHPDKKGIVLLFGAFEQERYRFRQESSFYYLTNIEEPGIALTLELDGMAQVYIPQYSESRAKWVDSFLLNASANVLANMGIDKLEPLGEACKGYALSSNCNTAEYTHLLSFIKKQIAQGNTIFTLYSGENYKEQRLILNSLSLELPELKNNVVDISSIVANMRRTKNQAEIELLYGAIDCTMSAHEAAAVIIEAGKQEFEIQAGLEFVFTQSGAQPAFPSIVASGKNGTVLHYTRNTSTLAKGDLVVIDAGAELDYYCGDITRTYPISGTFTKRQREVYTVVLETQRYIEELAKPGFWLSNKEKPEKSLHHIAQAFLEKKGYGKYFTHGLGHFLGLDVHDVGSYTEPLKEGDVITLEPGIYIPEERLAVRIEDNYWVVQDGILCLSEELPKDIELVEEMMVESDDEDYDYDEDYDDEN